jgi:DNA-directed RNA polymerase specialized sigma24 family protein
LVEEVQHPIYRLALRFLGHPEDAKDASQEILVRLIPKTTGRASWLAV